MTLVEAKDYVYVSDYSREHGFGVVLLQDDRGWFVSEVIPGSDADAADVTVGQRVTAINGEAIDLTSSMSHLVEGEPFLYSATFRDKAGSSDTFTLVGGGASCGKASETSTLVPPDCFSGLCAVCCSVYGLQICGRAKSGAETCTIDGPTCTTGGMPCLDLT